MASSDAETVAVDASKVPNRWMLIFLIAVGAVLMLGGVALFGYQFIHDSGTYGCTNEAGVPPGALIPECTGIQWYDYVPPFVVGLIISIVSLFYYKDSYVYVYSGTVTEFHKTYGLFGSVYHSIVIEGKTRAGETRTEKREVNWRTWHKLKEGDPYSWDW